MSAIEIFKPGTFRAMDGTEIKFSEVELRETAEAYDPEISRAPLVVGHPKTDDPAYGLVKRLEFSGSKLRADPEQVDPAFAELVNSGRFHTVSASFYTKTSPDNPKPGVFYLRHVGFLGAAQPSLKGLKRPTLSFQASDRGVVAFEFSEEQNATLWRRLREWFIGTFGIDKADQVVPDYAVWSLEQAVDAAKDTAPTMIGFTQPEKKEDIMTVHPGGATPPSSVTPLGGTTATTPATQPVRVDFAERQADLDRREAEIAQREKDQADRAVAARRADFQEFVKSLSGKVRVCHQPVLVEMLMAIPAETRLDFGEGTGKTQKPLVALAREFMAGLPDLVHFGEIAGGDVPDLNADPMAIARKAQEYQDEQTRKGFEVSFSECVKHVSKGGK